MVSFAGKRPTCECAYHATGLPIRLKYPLHVCYTVKLCWWNPKGDNKDGEDNYVPPINRNYDGPDLSYTCPENGTTLKPHDT